jgi:ATP-dependent Clp protease ATP-binding subunit ClpA
LEEYAKAKDFLDQAKRRGEYTRDITPELVAQLHVDTKHYETAQRALTEAGFDPSKEEKLEREAVSMLKLNPEWTAEDLRDVFKQAATLKRGVAASQKIAKAPVATVVAAAAKAKSATVTSKQKARENAMLQDPSKYGEFSAEDKTW